MAAPRQARMVVTIRRGPLTADVSVPRELPVAEIVPLLVDRLPGPGPGPDGVPQLCRLDGTPLEPDDCLAAGGVLDGDILTIEEPAHPPDGWCEDDFPQAVRRAVTEPLPPWSRSDAATAVALAVAVLAAGLSLLAGRWLTASWDPTLAWAATAGGAGAAVSGTAGLLARSGYRHHLVLLSASCGGLLVAAAAVVAYGLAAVGLAGSSAAQGYGAAGAGAAALPHPGLSHPGLSHTGLSHTGIGLAGAVAVLLAPVLPRLAAAGCGLESQALRAAIDPLGPLPDPATGLPPDLPDRLGRGHALLVGWTASASTVVLVAALSLPPDGLLDTVLAILLALSVLARVARPPSRTTGWLWLAGGLGSLVAVGLRAPAPPPFADLQASSTAGVLMITLATAGLTGLAVVLVRRASTDRRAPQRGARVLALLDQLAQVAAVPLAVLALR